MSNPADIIPLLCCCTGDDGPEPEDPCDFTKDIQFELFSQGLVRTWGDYTYASADPCNASCLSQFPKAARGMVGQEYWPPGYCTCPSPTQPNCYIIESCEHYDFGTVTSTGAELQVAEVVVDPGANSGTTIWRGIVPIKYSMCEWNRFENNAPACFNQFCRSHYHLKDLGAQSGIVVRHRMEAMVNWTRSVNGGAGQSHWAVFTTELVDKEIPVSYHASSCTVFGCSYFYKWLTGPPAVGEWPNLWNPFNSYPENGAKVAATELSNLVIPSNTGPSPYGRYTCATLQSAPVGEVFWPISNKCRYPLFGQEFGQESNGGAYFTYVKEKGT